ncbi:hypothetical protein [Pseudomonas fluorescens]|uniref:hypothetical protein n=1 Tax=Pseudomonas fluorescens TaxID=294 RepID=UPI001160E58A|nr:hypothetical protein [Pseudomonas fluorescens]
MATSLEDTLATAKPNERLIGSDNEKKPIDGLFQRYDKATGLLTLKVIGGNELQTHNKVNISKLSKSTERSPKAFAYNMASAPDESEFTRF